MRIPLSQLADRLVDRKLWSERDMDYLRQQLEDIAAELHQHQCAGERESVNAELLAALKSIVDNEVLPGWNHPHDICGCGSCSIRRLVKRAEAAEKAPVKPKACTKCCGTRRVMFDSFVSNGETHWAARPARGNESAVDCPDCGAPKQPDVVTGLVEALRVIAGKQCGSQCNDPERKPPLEGNKRCARCIAVDCLAAFEAHTGRKV